MRCFCKTYSNNSGHRFDSAQAALRNSKKMAQGLTCAIVGSKYGLNPTNEQSATSKESNQTNSQKTKRGRLRHSRYVSES